MRAAQGGELLDQPLQRNKYQSVLDGEFRLVSGEVLPEVKIDWEQWVRQSAACTMAADTTPLSTMDTHSLYVLRTYVRQGDPTLPGERTILVLPSFSHSSHAASNRDDPRPGWWENMVGPGKAINTSYFRVVCPSVLGSPFGATSPLTVDPRTGKPYKASFPQITPADMVRVCVWIRGLSTADSSLSAHDVCMFSCHST